MADNEKNLTKAEGKKPEKKAKEKKQNGFIRMLKAIPRWLREMKAELKKVVWPSGKQTVNNTIIVILCVIIIGAFIWVFDYLAGEGVKALIAIVRG